MTPPPMSATGACRINETFKENPIAIYCEKDVTHLCCIPTDEILSEISPTVGYLNAVGPTVELLLNPFIGVVCTKLGHRLPFLFGAFLQIAGSLIFLFAPSTALLFVARATCSLAGTICEISALMLSTIAYDATERAKILMFIFASTYPVAAMLSYFIGNAGYSFFGPRAPFGMLFGVGIIDAVLRLTISTDHLNENVQTDRHGEEPSEMTPVRPKLRKGTYMYIGFLTDCHFIMTILLMALTAFAFSIVSSTAPNWVTNVLHAQQWQLGLVLGISSAVHLIVNLACGMVVHHTIVWSSCFAAAF
jgi:MFS family permease